MQVPVYFVRSFTHSVFGGNPAAVCPLDEWLPTEMMQAIATENGVAETAFVVQESDAYRIRWFTPEIEMDLCGHATLAAAHVLCQRSPEPIAHLVFHSSSGVLRVIVSDENTAPDRLYTLDLPSRKPVTEANLPEVISQALVVPPVAILKSRDYVLVYPNEDAIKSLQPDEKIMAQINLDPGGVVVTAPGDQVDFVSRYFTPGASIFEDPVTGSAHCSLVPYWAEQLGKNRLKAIQLSARMGQIDCELQDDRVLLTGQVKGYLEGVLTI
ncbi:PhzF family phenazine biosynthesis protein [Hahella ganghwensis]|uniref:PhzF family phenazine biosynthesis protein n=1 Tax=Hahella ganghwensis TaxID=286420 RepID=UPI00035D177C|nr:PhzF family phenazine biosynthesis protein [Hahella ganghwensis]